ncbi:MAG: 2-polyprenylphenol 6-hydroxylase [Gammaproteobacteria bacterium]|nr:2-polyprenylphenol 6-hydroxylase [Gammaproteobacteria bacterium]
MNLIGLGLKAMRYRLDTLHEDLDVDVHQLPAWLRAGIRLSKCLPQPRTAGSVRLRRFLERLGPVAIKFGQLLSTRRDLMPDEMADELAKLQAQVAPFASALAVARIEKSLGKPIVELFEEFEEAPVASASVAQVHRARLQSGAEVAVKVVRPGIKERISEQIALMRRVAQMLERHSSDAKRLHLMRVVDDYEATILAELDMQQEAANTVKLRHNFAASPLLYVPRVYREFSGRDVLTLEFVEGVPISEVEQLKALGTDMKKLAERGVETFFTQVFVHNFFHADMHPGNILIDVANPAEPRYIALDCAIIGQLGETDRAYLAKNLMAFFRRDYKEVARLLLEARWAPAETDAQAFEAVIRKVCEPVFQKPLSQIEFGTFLLDLFRSARAFRLELQPQLVLLQKTLLYVEGLGRRLYPELDLWDTGKPFMERWMVEQFGPAASLTSLLADLPELFTRLPRLPAEIRDLRGEVHRLSNALADERARAEQLQRSDRRRQVFVRAAGVALVLFAGWSVSPLAGMLDAPDTMAGLVALAGVYLIVRA